MSFKSAFEGDFLVGVALSETQLSEQGGDDVSIARTHFNTITAENALKWESVHPEPDSFNFGPADQFVSFGEENGMFTVGHTLVWHNQTPRWVFEDAEGNTADRDLLLQRMRDHIRTVVGRYRDRIAGWDVVNEALNEDGSMRPSPWMQIIGEDYLVKAFEFAREADPAAKLYYNDYSLPNTPKRNGAVTLLAKLQSAGITVDGVGLQGHYDLTFPSLSQLDSTIAAFATMGIDVMITEMDIDVLPSVWAYPTAEIERSALLREELDPYTEGLPDSIQQSLSRRYAELFGVFMQNRDAISRVTFWGVTDRTSWKNDWPIRGRTNYPLLFDRAGRPKPAFAAVIGMAE